MIAVPAVDLSHGRCVQLVGGRPEAERISLPDPIAEARGWHKLGFEALHVVDLDAALGQGDNSALIGEILRATPARVQVGGGVRDDERLDELFAQGAARVVVGTRALEDGAWLARAADRHPGRVVLALDTRDGAILRRGWTASTGRSIRSFLPTLADLPLGGILATDVGREGRLEGIDRTGCRQILEASPHPVAISGGVTALRELEWLDQAGAAAVVLGMAIYTDTLNRTEVAARWGDDRGGQQ